MFASIIRNADRDTKSRGDRAEPGNKVLMEYLEQQGETLISQDNAFGYIINFSRPSWALRLFGESPRAQEPGVTATSKLIIRILDEMKTKKEYTGSKSSTK